VHIIGLEVEKVKNKVRLKLLLVMFIVSSVLILIAKSIPPTSIVEGRVKDIFGDLLPEVLVTLGKETTKTDEMGSFSFEDLTPGLYRLKVEAEGYEKYDKEFLADIGRNHIEIRGDNGLRPNTFAVDFHVFYAPTFEKTEQIFVFVGLYNGTKSKVTVSRISLFKPNAEFEASLITEQLILRKNDLRKIELSGISNPVRQGVYRLEVEILDKEEPILLQFYDTAQFDDNWDVHS